MLLRPTTTASRPGDGDPGADEQLDAAGRRARDELRRPALHHQLADVHRVEAVHVLVQADQVEHGLLVQPFGQRQLHEDAVDGRVGVQLPHQRFHLCLAWPLPAAGG